MPLFLKNIAPELDIFGNRQLFNFNKDPSSGESDSALTLINWFAPIPNVNANSTFEFLTPAMKGFRFNHSLSTTGTFGNFNFEKYDRFGTAVPLWGYDEVTDSFSMETNRITNLANGIANTDAITLGQLNSSITALGFSGLSTNGLIVRTGANTYASRSLAGSNGISITNTNGFSGNPTISLSNSYNTSANVTVNWWNSSVSTDILDYIISPSITYPILLQNITSGNSGTNNLRYWRTTSGLGDNTGANAYWSLSYYNQALGVDKVYMSIGIPQNTIYLNSKVDVNSNSIVNLNAGISGTDAVNKSQLDAKTVTSTQVTDFNTAVTSVLNNRSILHGYNATTYTANVATGDHIKFDSSVFTRGTAITLDASSTYSSSTNTPSVGRITLAAGKTYKLTGSINNVVSANYNGMRWYNSDTGAALGVISGMSSPVSTTDRVPSAGFVAYITTSVSTRVELRITWNALSSVNGTSDGIGPAWFIVEEV
jgi:Coiled stalk of trimeric autotransporter adhesin